MTTAITPGSRKDRKKRLYMTSDAPRTAERLQDLAHILDNQIGHYKRMSVASALDKQGIEAVKALTQIAQMLEAQQSREVTKLNETLETMTDAELEAAEQQILSLVAPKAP